MLLAQRANLNALEKPYNYLLMRHMKRRNRGRHLEEKHMLIFDIYSIFFSEILSFNFFLPIWNVNLILRRSEN